MTTRFLISVTALLAVLTSGCVTMQSDKTQPITAEQILGNPAYRAMSYSGWRSDKRADELAPSVAEIKEDMRLLEALDIKLIRTYNTQGFPQTERMLQAIRELKDADPGFEMYVMLGAWIGVDWEGAAEVDRNVGDEANNLAEIDRAIEMAMEYPDIVKIIAVGNEAMVTWQPHHVAPGVIHKWVKVLMQARDDGRLSPDLWITTSDNWAALGGEASYHNDDLVALLRDLDFISLHTYAFHDSYYKDSFAWAVEEDTGLPIMEQRQRAVARAVSHQNEELETTRAYLRANGIEKPFHIGETGWASRDDSHYGPEGTNAADEYTSKLFHDAVREWTEAAGMSCFYFQVIDEPWKSKSVDGSESHFGLFTVEGKAKAVLWDLVDAGAFEGLGRDGQPVTKTFGGDWDALMETVKTPVIIKHSHR